MRSLYYPASRPIARGKDFLLFLLSTAANRWNVVASLDLLVCWCPIIARVQTEMLRPLLGWLGTGNDDAIQGRGQQFHIVAGCSVDYPSHWRGRPPLACDGGGGIRGITRSHNASLTSHGWLLLIHGSPLQDQPIF